MTTKRLAINSPDHPWTDAHDHATLAAIARAIATDIRENERWGNDRQPVYDRTSGEYQGDDREDMVRAKTWHLHLYLPDGGWLSADEIADHVYRSLLIGEVERYEELYAELVQMIGDGRLQTDEAPEITVARLMRRSYTVERLRAEVQAVAGGRSHVD